MLDLNSKDLKVLDFPKSLQVVQGLESRGDFSFKGVHKMYLIVAESTEKFLMHKTLPTIDSLARDVSVDRKKIEDFMKELCFKYSPPIFRKMILVDYDPNGSGPPDNINTFLRALTVFARPSHADAGSAHRYVNGCNEISVNALKKWITGQRTVKRKEIFRDLLFDKIKQNKLVETYAATEINNLIHCYLDNTKELREVAVSNHIKPILRGLLDMKLLIFFRNEKAFKMQHKSIFLYNNKEELINRTEIYQEFTMKVIVPDLQKIGVITSVPEEVQKDPLQLAGLVLPYLNDSYQDQKTVVEEMQILAAMYKSIKDEQDKKEKKERVTEILALLESAGKIVDISQVKVKGESIPREIVTAIASNENVAYTEYSDKNDLFEFVLHKNCAPTVIQTARKVFEATGNDTDIRILSRMNLYNKVAPETIKELEAADDESLFKYLPFLTRIWRLLFGNIVVNKEEADQIRLQQEMEQKERIAKQKVKKIEEEKAKIVESRLKGGSKKTDSAPGKVDETEAMDESETGGGSMTPDQEREAKETITKIVSILDELWEQNAFPDRTHLLQKLGSKITEDQLIMFLKKNSGKEILSFQIHSKSGRYPWPILISRTFLKRNGKKMLEKAKKESDEQRYGLMPDQEKFDISSAMEEFLEKALPKI